MKIGYTYVWNFFLKLPKIPSVWSNNSNVLTDACLLSTLQMDVVGLQKDAMERILDWKKTGNKLQTSANIKLTSVRCTFLPGLHRLSSLPCALQLFSATEKMRLVLLVCGPARFAGSKTPREFSRPGGAFICMGNTWKYMERFLKLQNAMFFFEISLVAFKLDISNKFMLHICWPSYRKRVSKTSMTIMLNVPIVHNLWISGR